MIDKSKRGKKPSAEEVALSIINDIDLQVSNSIPFERINRESLQFSRSLDIKFLDRIFNVQTLKYVRFAIVYGKMSPGYALIPVSSPGKSTLIQTYKEIFETGAFRSIINGIETKVAKKEGNLVDVIEYPSKTEVFGQPAVLMKFWNRTNKVLETGTVLQENQPQCLALIATDGKWDDKFSREIVSFLNKNIKEIKNRLGNIERYHNTLSVYFKFRDVVFSHFSEKISSRYWEDSVRFQWLNSYQNFKLDISSFRTWANKDDRLNPVTKHTSNQNLFNWVLSDEDILLSPPWDDNREIWTLTLSLDLRRSTTMMAYAVDSKKFANWLEEMVLIFRRLINRNCGVFDKFTGDGVICHFLRDEIKALMPEPGRNDRLNAASRPEESLAAVYYGTRCAWEMIFAMKSHMKRAMPNLRVDSKNFGVGVGLGLEKARWSVDRNGSPIVVGPGVVDACRLTNDAINEVWTTPAVEDQLYQLNMENGNSERIDFISKEWPESAGMVAVKLIKPFPSINKADITDICEEIYEEIEERSQFL